MKTKEQNREYYLKNKESILEKQRKYRDTESRKQYIKRYREENRDKSRQYSKNYWEQNKEVLKEDNSVRGKKWYIENKEKKLEQGRKWQQNNRKRAVELVQRYVDNNKEKVLKYRKQFEASIDGKYRLIRYRHNKRWDAGLFTKNEFIKISLMPCKYCGDKNITKGIDRIDNMIGYTRENSVSCCKTCNYMKNKYSVEDFLNHIKKIYEHNL